MTFRGLIHYVCVYVYINSVKNGSSHRSVKQVELNCKKQVGSLVILFLLQIKFCQVFWQQVEQVKQDVLGTIIQSPGDFTRKLTVPSRGPCHIISFITKALLSLCFFCQLWAKCFEVSEGEQKILHQSKRQLLFLMSFKNFSYDNDISRTFVNQHYTNFASDPLLLRIAMTVFTIALSSFYHTI